MPGDGGVDLAVSDPSDHVRQLEIERARNERYLALLKEKRQNPNAPVQQVAGSSAGRGALPGNPLPAAARGIAILPLVGRVALDRPDPILGSDFYIGPCASLDDEPRVVSWAAPVAEVFFLGRSARHELGEHVLGRRTFATRLEDLVEFADDADLPQTVAESELFRQSQARPVVVPEPPPRPPSSPDRRDEIAVPHLREHLPEADSNSPVEAPSGLGTEHAPPDLDIERLAEHVAIQRSTDTTTAPAMRAERALRMALERSKTEGLQTILATLQPDQYRIVTKPTDRTMIVQGGPGTGKTIVAVHRAAYLLSTARAEGPLDSVGLIGPTSLFVEHVRHAASLMEHSENLDRIGSQRNGALHVTSLGAVFSDMAGLSEVHARDASTPDEARWDGDSSLIRFLRKCVGIMREQGMLRAGGTPPERRLVDAIGKQQQFLRSAFKEFPGSYEWAGEVKSFAHASQASRFLPFLAAAGHVVRPGSPRRKYGHLLVDEAQDLRQLEWTLIESLLSENGTLTVLGDINQRRSDHTRATWVQLAQDREWTDDDGLFVQEELTTGYRTTRQILEIANKLLPRGDRAVRALRGGEAPKFLRAPSTSTAEAVAVGEARMLAEAHRKELIAIISPDLGRLTPELRRKGWTPVPHRVNVWKRNGVAVGAYSAEQARGLEFDGVVVVEPIDFPSNVGRRGPLYTSLTRASKWLSIVHAKSLPKDLSA